MSEAPNIQHEALTSAAVAPRPHSTDHPGEHDKSKGVSNSNDSIHEKEQTKLPPTASAAAPAGNCSDACQALGSTHNDSQPITTASEQAVDDSDIKEPTNLDELVAALERKLAVGEATNAEATAALLKKLKREPVLDSLDLEGVSRLIASGQAKRIIVMCGAGVSVSAGIPDFRTPGTGLYSQLERFGLPEPEAVFSIGFFKKNPKPFHMLAKELFPGNYKPTPTHYFMKLLHDKGLLLRCFTQNIDSLENQAGLPQSAVVAAHGNFDSAHCIRCGAEHSLEHVKEAVFSDSICHCTKCGSFVKPDIVFFGEQLPDRFYERMEYDFPTCDLLLVMGTSLVVHPFASLIDAVPDHCPRVLINRERVGEGMGSFGLMGGLLGFGGSEGFVFDESEGAYRDVLYLGDTDDGVRELAGLLGWVEDLAALIADGEEASSSADKGLDSSSAAAAAASGSTTTDSSQSSSSHQGSSSTSQQQI